MVLIDHCTSETHRARAQLVILAYLRSQGGFANGEFVLSRKFAATIACAFSVGFSLKAWDQRSRIHPS